MFQTTCYELLSTTPLMHPLALVPILNFDGVYRWHNLWGIPFSNRFSRIIEFSERNDSHNVTYLWFDQTFVRIYRRSILFCTVTVKIDNDGIPRCEFNDRRVTLTDFVCTWITRLYPSVIITRQGITTSLNLPQTFIIRCMKYTFWIFFISQNR